MGEGKREGEEREKEERERGKKREKKLSAFKCKIFFSRFNIIYYYNMIIVHKRKIIL